MSYTNCATIDSKLINEIVRSYNTLDYTPKLVMLLKSIFPQHDFLDFGKLELHRKLNEVIVERYEGEQILKYSLFKAFQKKKIVAAYEIKVKNSRVDFLTINGHTTSFEIKSTLDNLAKLAKQSSDYLTAFEYNNLVIHERHLSRCLSIIPESFGVITVERGKQSIVRPPMLNEKLQPGTQLSLLSKRELIQHFKNPNAADILNDLPAEVINTIFKKALKIRYKTRWDFIVQHSGDILPIDLQFFFNKNIHPAHIYS